MAFARFVLRVLADHWYESKMADSRVLNDSFLEKAQQYEHRYENAQLFDTLKSCLVECITANPSGIACYALALFGKACGKVV